MLHSISWTAFITAVLVVTSIYYVILIPVFYRKELKRRFKAWLFLVPLAAAQLSVHAQTADANNGLNQANTMVRSYFDTATQLMYAVGAIVGLIGAIRIITTRHRQDMGGEIALWFGSCIFLVVVATVLKSFYGL